MAETLRQDGKAIDVTVNVAVEKGDPSYFEGFHGIAMGDAASGEQVALEVAERVHEITVDSGVTAEKGDILYIHEDQTVDATSSNGVAFGKVVLAKDENDVVWVKLMPQAAPIA